MVFNLYIIVFNISDWFIIMNNCSESSKPRRKTVSADTETIEPTGCLDFDAGLLHWEKPMIRMPWVGR